MVLKPCMCDKVGKENIRKTEVKINNKNYK